MEGNPPEQRKEGGEKCEKRTFVRRGGKSSSETGKERGKAGAE